MNVLYAGSQDSKEWDRYVNAHPDGRVFQAFAWRRVVQSTYGHKPIYLMVKQGSEICGVLPLFLINSRLFGRVLATCPYASTGAICSDDEESSGELIQKAIQLAREMKVNYLELKSFHQTKCSELQSHTDYYDYYLPLDEPEILWRTRFKGKVKNKIRQAEKFGMTYDKGHYLLDAFYQIMTVSMRRLGTPVHSKSFYQNILNCFGAQANILAVRYNGIPVSSILLLRYRQDITALISCSLSEYHHLHPNNYLYWKLFNDSYLSGAIRYDFGRSLLGSGPAKFKESWGAESKPLYYEYFLNRKAEIPRMHQGNSRYLLARRLWSNLPLGFTKLVGPHLIRNIP